MQTGLTYKYLKCRFKVRLLEKALRLLYFYVLADCVDETKYPEQSQWRRSRSIYKQRRVLHLHLMFMDIHLLSTTHKAFLQKSPAKDIKRHFNMVDFILNAFLWTVKNNNCSIFHLFPIIWTTFLRLVLDLQQTTAEFLLLQHSWRSHLSLQRVTTCVVCFTGSSGP